MFSATDIANFLACPHLTALDRAEKNGEISKPFFSDHEKFEKAMAKVPDVEPEEYDRL